MAYQRYLIEFGQGSDLHGEDQTKAALRAVKDAMHHCCMAGVHDIFGLNASRENIRIKAQIFVPVPESVDPKSIEPILNMYDTEIQILSGGASFEGLYVPELGHGHNITIAIAALTVYLNISEGGNNHE